MTVPSIWYVFTDALPLDLNYWKEHRQWAAEVISNEVPNYVKVKRVFDTQGQLYLYCEGTVQSRKKFPFHHYQVY